MKIKISNNKVFFNNESTEKRFILIDVGMILFGKDKKK